MEKIQSMSEEERAAFVAEGERCRQELAKHLGIVLDAEPAQAGAKASIKTAKRGK